MQPKTQLLRLKFMMLRQAPTKAPRNRNPMTSLHTPAPIMDPPKPLAGGTARGWIYHTKESEGKKIGRQCIYAKHTEKIVRLAVL
jgi:hypothetical protein